MGELLEDLKRYLATESEEQIQKDMDALDEYNLSGPDMLCVLDSNILVQCMDDDFETPNISHKMDASYDCPQYEFAA